MVIAKQHRQTQRREKQMQETFTRESILAQTMDELSGMRKVVIALSFEPRRTSLNVAKPTLISPKKRDRRLRWEKERGPVCLEDRASEPEQSVRQAARYQRTL
jgi:hypothetical protein